MYQGKYNQQQHQQRRKRRRKLNNRALILLASLVLIVGMAAGGTVAWLITNTGAVQNTMVPASVPIIINEKISGTTTKESVQIVNDGNTDAYIRVAIIANAVDKDGNVIAGNVPTYNVDTTKWELKNDGYYYYKGIVSAKGSTPPLFIGNVDFADGEVNILAESIQVHGGYGGMAPEMYAWGVPYNNGNWK